VDYAARNNYNYDYNNYYHYNGPQYYQFDGVEGSLPGFIFMGVSPVDWSCLGTDAMRDSELAT